MNGVGHSENNLKRQFKFMAFFFKMKAPPPPPQKKLFQIFIIILTKLVFDILFGSRELILGIKHVVINVLSIHFLIFLTF